MLGYLKIRSDSRIFSYKLQSYLLMIVFSVLVINDLTTGVVSSRYYRYYLSTDPANYWRIVRFHAVFILLGFFFLWISAYKNKFVFVDKYIYIVRFFEILFIIITVLLYASSFFAI